MRRDRYLTPPQLVVVVLAKPAEHATRGRDLIDEMTLERERRSNGLCEQCFPNAAEPGKQSRVTHANPAGDGPIAGRRIAVAEHVPRKWSSFERFDRRNRRRTTRVGGHSTAS